MAFIGRGSGAFYGFYGIRTETPAKLGKIMAVKGKLLRHLAKLLRLLRHFKGLNECSL